MKKNEISRIVYGEFEKYSDCLSRYERYTLTKVMTCLAYGESWSDPHCAGGGLGNAGRALGLFQLSSDQFNHCRNGNGKPCDAAANGQAAVNMVIGHCKSFKKSIGRTLYHLFGQYRPVQGERFQECMRYLGEDIAQVRKILNGIKCDKCSTNPKCNGG
jgi:hypothetical protein